MAKKLPREVTVSQAARKLPALVKRLRESPEGRIALTVRGEVRAWLTAAPEDGNDAELEPSRHVSRLVKRALKLARD